MAAASNKLRTSEQRSAASSPLMIWGQIPLEVKIPTIDTGRRLFAFQHTNMSPGGPPRHVHHDQDEIFFVLDGEFVMEIGDERFELKRGDMKFAPRGIPHAWACVSKGRGTLLTMVSPAGTFERFILETTEHATLPTQAEIAAAFEANGMTLLGPPLDVE